ncbi:MAG TPA: DUF4468 domain-containing protein [Flavipsychrobacter sp.]|nr:DUF4468 domain-containing protein [Flavipsychrobacter sp.]
MKHYLYAICLTIFSTVAAFAQDSKPFTLTLDESTGMYYYEEVVQLSNVTQMELYSKAKKWIIANFKTGDNNISEDEKEYNIVNSAALKIDKKKTMGWAVYDGTTDFKFHFWAKDGRYKIRIDNVAFQILYASYPDGTKTKSETYGTLKSNSKIDNYLKGQADEKLLAVIQAFKKGMTAAPSQEKKDW